MDATSKTSAVTKIPQVTLVFWVMKIAATTLGETGGDLLAQTMKIGYAVSTLILLGIMFATLAAQLRVRKFSPALYWTVIATTSMAGTTISDYIDRTLKWGYYKGSVVLIVLLIAALVFWKVRFGSLSISGVNRFSLEVTFWTTVLIANTLGTAGGDWLSDNTGLGFGRATLVIIAMLGFVALLHFRTTVSKVVLFWAGFVLIQPFGATAGDVVTKAPAIGGMGFPTYYASAILTAFLVLLIVTTDRRVAARRHVAPRRRSAAARPVVSAADVVVRLDDELNTLLELAGTAVARIEAELAALAGHQRALASRAEELRRTETEVLDRLHQAATLWEGVFRHARPAASDGNGLDIREPIAAKAFEGNGAH